MIGAAILPLVTLPATELDPEDFVPYGWSFMFTNGLWVTLTGTGAVALVYFKPRN